MRLIDADDFFARMENDTDLCAEMETDGLKALKKYLDMQPTAYSVGKVVEELEEMIHPKQLYFCKYARGGCKHLDNNDKDCMECVVENAIEIVKQGGVSDDVCEWKLDGDMAINPHTFIEYKIKDFDGLYALDTCPYCRKKIKVVE